MSLYDRLHVFTSTSGTGAYTVTGTATNRLSIDQALDAAGVTKAGAILELWVLPDDSAGSDDFEHGLYTYDGTSQLTRTRIIRSSNGDAAVNWGTTQRNIVSAPSAALLNRLFDTVPCGLAGGSANALSLSPTMPIHERKVGRLYLTIAAYTNTGATTADPSTLGTGDIKLHGNALAGGEIVAGCLIGLLDEGTDFSLIQFENRRRAPVARSSNTILGVGDHESAIIATSTFTQTLTAAATLGKGWWVDYRNDGAGMIALDPDGAELIDGAAIIALAPGQSCRILCDGTGFKTVGLSAGLQKGYLFGLECSRNGATPNTKMDVVAGSCVDTTGAVMMAVAAGTIDLTTGTVTSAALGMDGHSVPTSNEIHIFVIGKTDGSTSLLAATSATAPTLPSGYTYFRRIASWPTDSSGNLVDLKQIGDRFLIRNSIKLANGSAGSFSNTAPTLASISLTGAVPSTASELLGTAMNNYGGAALANLYVHPWSTSGGWQSTSNVPHVGVTGNATQAVPFRMPLQDPTQIYWASQAAGGAVMANGWIDRRGRDA